MNVSKSSVNSMKKAYVECVKQKRRDESDDEVATLPPKKQGRPLLLGENVERQLQLYLKKSEIREG